MVETSVIIPNYNGWQKTLCLVEKILPSINADREIIIVDDGSSDDPPINIMKYVDGRNAIRLVQQENKGRSSARNTGASNACGNFLVFVDNDIIPGESFLDRMEAVHKIVPEAWITGSVVQDVKKCPHEDFLIFRKRLDYVISNCSGLVEVESFTTQQLGVGKSRFLQFGGFNERLRDCEDFELSVRVRDAGNIIIHDTQNIVRHADYATLRDFVSRQNEYRRARLALKCLQPDLAVRFPDLFRDLNDMSVVIRTIRKCFRYNSVWSIFLESSIGKVLPRGLRFWLFDLIISSSFLLADVDDE